MGRIYNLIIYQSGGALLIRSIQIGHQPVYFHQKRNTAFIRNQTHKYIAVSRESDSFCNLPPSILLSRARCCSKQELRIFENENKFLTLVASIKIRYIATFSREATSDRCSYMHVAISAQNSTKQCARVDKKVKKKSRKGQPLQCCK